MMLILASNSPRRRQLMALGGWEFSVSAAEVDETPQPGETPPGYVRRLAERKALAAASMPGPAQPAGRLYLAADTTVADPLATRGAEILGKPADAADARRMLHTLRARSHLVYTALALYRPADDCLLTDVCCTEVPMRNYTDLEMEAYIASGDPLDKAGAYAIQHAGFHPVEGLCGCFANVMGMPLCHLARLLRKLEIPSRADLPQACQAAQGYACPVFGAILRGDAHTACAV